MFNFKVSYLCFCFVIEISWYINDLKILFILFYYLILKVIFILSLEILNVNEINSKFIFLWKYKIKVKINLFRF